jgi:hypothetical protein
MLNIMTVSHPTKDLFFRSFMERQEVFQSKTKELNFYEIISKRDKPFLFLLYS